MLNDLQQFMDPSRNMSKYRQHLNSVSSNPPVMPIYPILKKDLTFAHESKPTFCGALINFEKLRMIARIIRSVTLLCSVKYDLEYLNGQVSVCFKYYSWKQPSTKTWFRMAYPKCPVQIRSESLHLAQEQSSLSEIYHAKSYMSRHWCGEKSRHIYWKCPLLMLNKSWISCQWLVNLIS